MTNAKKLLALVLALVMCVGLFAACGDKNPTSNPGSQGSNDPANTTPEPTEEPITWENKVIIGSTTQLSGDFRYPGWGGSSAGASDQDVWRLTAAYATQELDELGAYVWNDVVVKSHSEVENEDGTLTINIELNEGLTFSDGSPITAQNYVASALAMSTPVAIGAGLPGMAGQTYVGFNDFAAYTGPGSEAGTKEFSGVRMFDDYNFAVTVDSAYYPYYYAFTYGGFSCYPMGLFTGEGVTIADDGNGCYLSDNFYDKDGEDYVVSAQIIDNRYDVTKFPFSGPYVISEWDEGTSQCTMTLNPEYKGNYEGQKPTIETVVYALAVQETMVDQLATGAIDILAGVTGGDDTKKALEIVDGEKFAEVHYQRAGYGKIQFDCDFGPTSFQEVRQAVAYLMDRADFCQAFTGGYGVVIDGPYSPDFAMWHAVRDDIDLIDYSYSPDTAVKVLEDGGWIYNSKGEPWEPGQSGVDAVRYKKLTAEQAEATDIFGQNAGVNKGFASVANADGVEYKTVQVNGEYYMPLVINWFGTADNVVTDMIGTYLANSADVAAAGMVVRATTGDFNALLGNIYREPSYGYLGTPVYGMYNLATGWNTAMYDYARNWMSDPAWAGNSVNKLIDEYDTAFPYDMNGEKLSYEEAVAASGDKLGIDYLSFGMVYNAKTEDEYNQWWMGYIERWNQLMPDIPLYSNYYYDVYNAHIENLETTAFRGPAQAIIYANVKGY